MRIVQLANFYSPTSGGLRVAVDRLRAGYLDSGVEVSTIVPGPWRDNGPTGSTGIELQRIASPALPNGSGYRMIASRAALVRRLELARPDVIEAHDKLLALWSARWAAERGIPIVLYSHERFDEVARQFLPRVASGAPARRVTDRFLGRVAQACSVIVAGSRFAAAEFGAHAGVRIVSLAVDLQRYRARLDDGVGDPVRLVFLGRLSAEKRPDLAIATLERLLARGIAAELTVVGAGPFQARLRSQAAHLPVRFTGYLDAAGVARALGASDICLATGPAETFGLAALESLACGTPIVAVRGAATADFVALDPRAGRVATAEPLEFAAATEELLATPAASRRRAARSVAERYSWDRTVAGMLDIHASLCSGPMPVS